MTKVQAWWQFTKERFEPGSHLTMIAVFLLAHILVISPVKTLFATTLNDIVLLIGVIAFYLKLRLYDEVKDYELDVIINKQRPLPRGLLKHQDMYKGMFICIAIELVTFATQGLQSLITITIAILYSLLMYKEFFIPAIIRPHLTTYALVHTIVTALLSFAIFSFLSGASLLEIIKEPTLLNFALANWLLFNIFEFGRKTFATSEERKNVDTYSSLFGPKGAVTLVISQALLAYYLSLSLKGSNHAILLWGLGGLFLALCLLALRYILSDTESSARHYRFFSSAYIVIFYTIIIMAHLIP